MSSAEVTRTAEADWWRQAVVYQIYPRSFADDDGDGVGDLRGITSRADYLRDLGVDAVWLSPFYPSALADGGYDVDDYRDVSPQLGTLDDFDRLSTAMHDRGLKLIVDIVPNHTSNRHVWFQEALAAGRGSDARDRYIFREGSGPDGAEPPADWPSMFGGPAWTQVEDGQWYLHLFATEQPDLNWDRRDVRDDFLTTLAFWADRGVDGFRVDVAHLLSKDLTEPLPPHATFAELTAGQHPLEDRDEVHEIYAEWREVFNRYDPPRTAVAEAWVDASRRPRYATPAGLGQAFNFDLLLAPFDAEAFRTVITENLALAAESGSSSTWVLSNHDTPRHATRYGLTTDDGASLSARDWMRDGADPERLDVDLGLRRARAATQLILALPGSTYLYQGEELGLREVTEIPATERQDPAFFRAGGLEIGRDGCRVPLPWTDEDPSYGFSTAAPHLPQPASFAELAVSVEDGDPASTLTHYRAALAARARLQSGEELTWVEDVDSVVHFARPGGWHSVTNFGVAPVELVDGEVVLVSSPLLDGALPPQATAWVSAPTD